MDKDRYIYQIIEQQSEQNPERIALVHGQHQLSYRELNRRANQLARYLSQAGVGPESIVGLYLERSVEQILALLGIWKAGGAYLPLNAAYPQAQLAAVLEESQTSIVITQQRLAANLPPSVRRVLCLDAQWVEIAQQAQDPCPGQVGPQHLAYVIYTSGSAGRPKGVLIEHRCILTLAQGLEEAIFSSNRQEPQRVSLNGALAFDTSVKQLIQLARGHTLCVVPERARFEARVLAQELHQQAITVLDCTPSQLRILLQEQDFASAGPQLSQVLVGGEAIDTHLWQLLAQYQQPQFYNVYGPTECTVDSTVCRVDSSVRHPSLGVPLPSVRLYVLDTSLQPVPQGVVAEIYIGGEALARGYLGCPELTAQAFLPDPFSQEPGARMYRTRDLGQLSTTGSLEFAGRSDTQVKIRGFRVELSEIEHVLNQYPQVAESVVLAQGRAGEDKRLVAYVVPRSRQEFKSEEIRRFLRQKLPDYMVPAVFVKLESLPLTGNAKVDRRALQVLELALEESHQQYIASCNLEQRGTAADNWTEMLRSQLTRQVIARRHEALKQEEESPRWEEEAHTLSYAQEQLWFLAQLLPHSSLYNMPLAMRLHGPLQVGALWRSLQQLVQRHSSLRTRFGIRGEGKPVQWVQQGQEAVKELPVWVVDLRDLPYQQRDGQASQQLQKAARKAFALAERPAWRAGVWMLEEQEHLLLLVFHHIAVDGWSISLLLRDLSALYTHALAASAAPAATGSSQRNTNPLPELSLQYSDFVQWQRKRLQGEVLEQLLAYWRAHLTHLPTLQLPLEGLRPAVQRFEGKRHTHSFPFELYQRLKQVSRREGVTLYMLLLTGFLLLLKRFCQQEDLVVGTPVTQRPARAFEPVVGMFVNMLVLRFQLGEDLSVRQMLSRVREGCLQAYSHQDLPFALLVQALAPERALSHNPLYQVTFALHQGAQEPLKLLHVRSESLEVETGMVPFDVALDVWESEQGIRCVLAYQSALLSQPTAQRLLEHYEHLLDCLSQALPQQRLSHLALLPPREKHQLLWLSQETTQAQPPSRQEGLLHDRLARQVERCPDAIALVVEMQQLSYWQLDHLAGQLAWRLKQEGIEPEQTVGVYLSRSPLLVIALLGVLKAGGAYVPLETQTPRMRLRQLLSITRVQLLLTETELVAEVVEAAEGVRVLDLPRLWPWRELPTEAGQEAEPERGHLDQLAYLISTSGSTGEPKAVMVSHRQLVNLVEGTVPLLGFGQKDCWSLFHSCAFDFSVWEMWGPLLTGGRLVMVPYWQSRSPHAFGQLLAEQQVTILNQTPSALGLLLEELSAQQWQQLCVRLLILGGEALDLSRVGAWVKRWEPGGIRLVNMYGITETTVHASWYAVGVREVERQEMQGTGGSPIGKALPNLELYVLDEKAELVPLGVMGELYVGGAGVARGYFRRPELTAERFVPHPWSQQPGARLYRSGDLARYRSDGVLEYLGRRDSQVKLHGYRIELGEIEAVLRQHPGVQEAVVLVWEEEPADKRLVAYIVPAPSWQSSGEQEPLSSMQFRHYLQERLPSYMLPSSYVLLEQFSLTPNGKLDRQTLPAPARQSSQGPGYQEPRSETERLLAQIWARVLGVGRVGIQDNFFELGGDSILSIQVVVQARKEGLELTPSLLFEHQTIAELATQARQRSPAREPEVVPSSTAGPFTLVPLDEQELHQLSQLFAEQQGEDV